MSSLATRKNSFAPLTDIKARQQRGQYGNNSVKNKGELSWHQKLRSDIRHKFNIPHPGKNCSANTGKYATLDSDNASGSGSGNGGDAKDVDLSVVTLSQSGLINQFDSLVIFPRIGGDRVKDFSKSAKDLTRNPSLESSSKTNDTNRADLFLCTKEHLTSSKASIGKARSSCDISYSSGLFPEAFETEPSSADFFACIDTTRRSSEILTTEGLFEPGYEAAAQKRRSTIADPFGASFSTNERSFYNFSNNDDDVGFFDSFNHVSTKQRQDGSDFQMTPATSSNEKTDEDSFKTDFSLFSSCATRKKYRKANTTTKGRIQKEELFKTYSSPGYLSSSHASSNNNNRKGRTMDDDRFKYDITAGNLFSGFDEVKRSSSEKNIKNKSIDLAVNATMVTPTEIIVKSMGALNYKSDEKTVDTLNNQKSDNYVDALAFMGMESDTDALYKTKSNLRRKGSCNILDGNELKKQLSACIESTRTRLSFEK